MMHLFAFDILGLKSQESGDSSQEREEAFGKVVDMVLELRADYYRFVFLYERECLFKHPGLPVAARRCSRMW